MKAVRVALWGVLALVVLAAAGLGVFVLSFDTAGAVARLAAQVRRDTGRELRVVGPVRLAASWPPEVVAAGVSLSNPAGASRAAMFTAAAVRARVAILPLLEGRAELDVVLVRPDVLLEDGNWRFTPEPPPVSSGPAGASRAPLVRTELRRVRVEEGRVAVRAGGVVRAVNVPEATVTLGGGLGDGLGGGGASWAGRLVADAGTGVRGALTASGAAAAGGFPLHLAFEGDAGFGVLDVTNVTVDAPGTDAPGRLKVTGRVRGNAVAVDLAVTPADVLRSDGPTPFTLAAAAAGATLTAQGNWRGVSALDASVSARAPDLAALSGLAGTALPGLGAVAVDGRVLTPAGLTTGVAIRSLRVTGGPGNLAGDVAVGWGATPSLRGSLTSSRLDVDAIVRAMPGQTGVAPAPAPAPAAAAPQQAAPAPVPAAAGRVIPDWALPLGVLRAVDLDVAVAFANLVLAGEAVPGLDGHVTVGNGRARLDPIAVTTPAGRVEGVASVDATGAVPAVAAAVHGAGLRLERVTDAVHGTADVDVDLSATGASTVALAATLDGRGSVRLLNGDVANRLLAPVLDAALRAVHLGLDLSGRSALRCFLLPFTAAHGVVSTPGFWLDTARVRVEGEGSADLGAETLSLQLRPSVVLGGGATAEAPVRVTGPFAHPTAALGDVSGRAGVRIGMGGRRPGPDACGPEPAGAAPEPPRMGKPADILRGLLR